MTARIICYRMSDGVLSVNICGIENHVHSIATLELSLEEAQEIVDKANIARAL